MSVLSSNLNSYSHPLKENFRPGVVAHAYNPNTLGGRGRWITKSTDRDHPGQQGETPSLLKIQKLAMVACAYNPRYSGN